MFKEHHQHHPYQLLTNYYTSCCVKILHAISHFILTLALYVTLCHLPYITEDNDQYQEQSLNFFKEQLY